MVWRNDPLVLYHGTVGLHATDLESNGPDLIKCRLKRDFGRGFYTTRRYAQSVEFANSQYQKMRSLYVRDPRRPDPECAAIVEYIIDRNARSMLDTLAFVFPDRE